MENVALETGPTLLEIPLGAPNAFDAMLGHQPSLRKVRQRFQTDLGKMHTVSIGKRGTVSLANTSYWSCVATARRWDAAQADELVQAYRKAGLNKLLTSKRYEVALEVAKAAIKAAASAYTTGPWHPVSLVTRTILNLMRNAGPLRTLAEEMTKIAMEVDIKKSEVARIPGWVERIDGDQALIVVRTDKGNELRAVQRDLLAKCGIPSPGDRFVIHRLSWSPDTTTEVYVPALALEDPAATDLEEELRAAESPMPTPASAGASVS
jgi:hypothetical protein